MSITSRSRPAVSSILFLNLLSWLCGCGIPKVDTIYSASSVFDEQSQRVILVSFDGARPDALEATSTPHIHSLIEAGAYSFSARSVYPSITLVNHASMISGVGPEKHGIHWNTYVPENGLLNVPSIFDQARAKGLVTAMVAGKDKFRHLNRIGSLSAFEIEDGTPYSVAKKAMSVLIKHRPHLLMVHFRHGDSAGHEHGWMSREQLDAFTEADQALGHILHAVNALGMFESTTVLITADHGGHGKKHGTDDPVDMTIPWIAAGAEVPLRGTIDRGVSTIDTAATIADLLELDVPQNWDGLSVFR